MARRPKRTHRMARAASAFQTIEYMSQPRWRNPDACCSDEKASAPALPLSHGLDRLQVGERGGGRPASQPFGRYAATARQRWHRPDPH